MKRLVITICFSAALVMATASPARADEASKQEKAAKLVETMHMEKTMSQMMDLMTGQFKQSFEHGLGTSGTPQQREVVNNFMNKTFDLMKTQLSWSVLKPDMVKLYADNLTEEEIDGLNTFYASAVG